MSDNVVRLSGTPLPTMDESQEAMLDKVEIVAGKIRGGEAQGIAIAIYRTDGLVEHVWHCRPGKFFSLSGALSSLQYRMMADQEE
jgi:hypothetical protein